METKNGVNFYKGLSSPGPGVYNINAASPNFARAATKSAKPTWGPPPTHRPQKTARTRCDEMRYSGKMFLSELKGHFSPGPQYSIPGCFGGAPANQFASEAKLKADRTRYSGLPPRTSQTLLAAMESGEPCFSLTSGSFCDPLRPLARAMTEHKNSTYWRQATMVQQSERHSTTPATVMESQCPDGGFQALPWTERARGPSLMGDEAQRAERQRLESRGRNVPSPGAPPYRSLEDYVADPPLANVFGATKSRSDYGTAPRLGGLGASWRESKLGGNNSVGTSFGPRPSTHAQKVRYAFIQPLGANSVPRSAPHADFEGGRITMYKVLRPGTAESLGLETTATSASKTLSGFASPRR